MERIKITDAEIRVQAENEYKNNYILTHTSCIDITGDLIAGTLLDRIMYWFSADKNGRRRVRVVRDGYYWLVKKRTDWYDEIRISPKQYDRAAKILTEKGLIHTAVFHFSGTAQTHIRPDYETYYRLIDEWKTQRAEKAKQNIEAENRRIDAYNEKNRTIPLLTEEDYEGYDEYVREADNDEYEKYRESFEALWSEYPKKIGKSEALEAYAEDRRRNAVSDNVILAAIIAYKKYIDKYKIQYRYVKNGSAWFKNRCWFDKYDTRDSYRDSGRADYDYAALENRERTKERKKE